MILIDGRWPCGELYHISPHLPTNLCRCCGLEGQLQIWRRKANLAAMHMCYEAFLLGALMWNFRPAIWISYLWKVRLTKGLTSHLTGWYFDSITRINPRRAYRVELDCMFALTHLNRKPHFAATDWHFCLDEIMNSYKDSAPQQFFVLYST
jgi:hypothetical protein